MLKFPKQTLKIHLYVVFKNNGSIEEHFSFHLSLPFNISKTLKPTVTFTSVEHNSARKLQLASVKAQVSLGKNKTPDTLFHQSISKI